MSLLQNPLSNATYHLKLYNPINTTYLNSTKTLKFSLLHHQTLQNYTYPLQENFNFRLSVVKAQDSSFIDFQEQEISPKLFNLDAFLSFLESIFVVSSAIVSAGFFVNWAFFKQHNHGLLLLGNRLLVWLLAGAVVVGSMVRRRQWSRVCGSSMTSKPGSETGNVIERIEKLEESMRNATSIIRMLSRQLEKLGIRFRVTRKALKDPITEAAALAMKNSAATSALAEQEGILEKELAEVQKILLAMQDQQQKQLELILAIAKSGKLVEVKQTPSQVLDMNKPDSDNGLKKMDGQQIQTSTITSGS